MGRRRPRLASAKRTLTSTRTTSVGVHITGSKSSSAGRHLGGALRSCRRSACSSAWVSFSSQGSVIKVWLDGTTYATSRLRWPGSGARVGGAVIPWVPRSRRPGSNAHPRRRKRRPDCLSRSGATWFRGRSPPPPARRVTWVDHAVSAMSRNSAKCLVANEHVPFGSRNTRPASEVAEMPTLPLTLRLSTSDDQTTPGVVGATKDATVSWVRPVSGLAGSGVDTSSANTLEVRVLLPYANT